MAEKIISPGVFTRENDLSFLPQGVGEIGAAIVGPTVKGPVGIPTQVTSYAEYVEKFGNTFKSGSSYYQYLTSHTAEQYLQNGGPLTVVRIAGSGFSHASSSVATGSEAATEDGTAFKLRTLSDGANLNSFSTETTNNLLPDGTKDNIRWEVTSKDNNTGTFNLIIRRGDDTSVAKTVLESWSNLSLDPNSTNYIAKVIGDQKFEVRGTTSDPYLQLSGSFSNKSRYVRVEVLQNTIDYLDENGDVRVAAASASLPVVGSGSFEGGADGTRAAGAAKFYDSITSTNAQGFNLSDGTNTAGGASYLQALQLLQNQDEYDINMILTPGANQNQHSAIVDKAIKVCEARGDAFTIVDPAGYGASITTVTDEASDYNSSYAAMYWPWVQVPDNQLGKLAWVPAGTVLPGVLAFNDRVSHEWYAPAGLNRGGIDAAVRAERKLTHTNRDTLYAGRVNPLATFPGQGVCVWGQKTLQKKPSALDRVNVRRLLINLKKFIASTSRYLVFENNTNETRNRFLSTVVPYMERVQQNNGLFAFKVVMDGTNNTPDIIDRNIMKGDIYIQPAKAAEFIVVDFNVMPTGATFGE